MKKYRKDEPLKVKGFKLKHRYGISLEEFNSISLGQNGLCAVCKVSKATHVDHCHKTKRVRGLLCRECNSGIGMLKDNLKFLQNAIVYLENR